MSSRFNYFNNQPKSQDIHSVLSYWDKKLECKFANYETINWFGLNPADLSGQFKLEVLLGTDYKLHHPYILEVFNGKSQAFEYDKIFLTSQVQPVIATYFPDIESGVVVGFFLHLSLKRGTKYSNILSPNSDHAHQMLESSNKIPQVVTYLRSQLFIGFPKLEYLAKIHCISVSKLMRDFKKMYGTSPFLFFRNLQMEFASKHLKETGYSKKQLAMMLGFSNPANFTTCYNKWQKDEELALASEIQAVINKDSSLKLLIAQIPVAVAILDKRLNVVEMSEKWMCDFSLTHLDKKLNIFNFLPNNAFAWLKILVECLQGRTRSGQHDLIEFENGTKLMLNWEVKPWLDVNSNVIGVIIYIPVVKSVYEREQVYFEHQ